jgi:hypothetical protein
VFETQRESRAKALFRDDSLLNVGEQGRVEITEYTFDPNQEKRSVIVHLLRGKLRAATSGGQL